MSDFTDNFMSPAQAADIAKVSRWTIMRAIKALKIKAVRDNKGNWKIQRDDLDAWIKENTAHTPHNEQHTVQHSAQQPDIAQPAHPPAPDPQLQEQAIEIAVLRERVTSIERTLEDVKTDRDRWRDQADQLAKRRRWFWQS